MKRSDFLKRQFATGGSSQPCTQGEAALVSTPLTTQPHPQPIAIEAPVDPSQPLAGLHLSALDLATGLERAFTHLGDMHPTAANNALAFADCINTAYHAAHPDAPRDGIEPLLEALRSGSWAPSLTSLIDAGATQAALSYMPTGKAQLHIEPHAPVSVSTRHFQPVVEGLAELPTESRAETLGTLAKIEGVFGGMLMGIEPWTEPPPTPPRRYAEFVSFVGKEAP